MKRQRRVITIIAIILIIALGISSCGANKNENPREDEKIKIVATIFPAYDWVMNIIGDNPGDFEVTLLLEKGTDLHSYQPTVEDILKISTCDLFIYVGGESDKWVDTVLTEATNKDMKVIRLMEVLGEKVKEEELVEGMQEEDHHDEEGHHDEEETEYDEHVWLSLRNGVIFTEAIEKEVEFLDPKNAEVYKENADKYIEKLKELDQEYMMTIAASSRSHLLFGDRFPFRYLLDDYGLMYYAAFPGCSAETEASFETITFLAKQMDENNLPSILILEGSDGKIAETIIQNTKTKDQTILELNSLQSVTSKDIEEGKTYLGIMEENLKVLKEALF